MSRRCWIAVLCYAALGCALLLAGCGAKKGILEQGSISGNTYTNDYFHLSMDYPAGWVVAPQESKRAVERAGSDIMTANAPAGTKGAIEGSVQRTYYLLVASQLPIGTPTASNPNLILLAEDLGPMPSIKTGMDYLVEAKRTLAGAGVALTIDKEPYDYLVNGKQFSRMDITMTVPQANNAVVHEALIITVRNGYAVGATMTWTDPQPVPLMEKYVQTLTLK